VIGPIINMPIQTKNDGAPSQPEGEAPLQFRNNPEVQKRLDAYKGANQTDVAYYTRVVKEAPQRAVDMLLYKDMQRHEADMRMIEKQMPAAKEFYDAQSAEVKARIDGRLQNVQPYYKEKAFVNEVLREMNRANRQMLTTPKTGTVPKMGA
jgi:hypothetical protein